MIAQQPSSRTGTKAVRTGSPNSWLIGDMSTMSDQPGDDTAIRDAGRILTQAGCDAVKLEGGAEMADRMAGIPDMGHPGLTPQSVSALGGFWLQGEGFCRQRRSLMPPLVHTRISNFAWQRSSPMLVRWFKMVSSSKLGMSPGANSPKMRIDSLCQMLNPMSCKSYWQFNLNVRYST
jgi:hypothetical protein